jgi:hypothetical protein
MRKLSVFKINHHPLSLAYLAFCFLTLFQTVAISQTPGDSTRAKISPGFFTGFNTIISNSQLISEGIGSVADMKTVRGNTYSGTIETGYFFSAGFGFTTGVGIISFRSGSSLENYSNKFTTRDSENELYERRITGSGINEDQKISFLSIPLLLNLRIPGRSIFAVYIDFGINCLVPLTQQYSSSGIFSYAGYYPAYNVLLENLPEYGYQGNTQVSTNGQLELKSYSFEGIASAGFQFLIANKIQLSLGATYARSLSSISSYASSDKFQLSTDASSIKSMLGGSSSSFAESMGLRLSLKFFFKKSGYRGMF